MFGLGFQEVIIVGIVAVLLFGKRLPEVARSLGASYNEFRRGLSDLQSQMDVTSYVNSTPRNNKGARAYEEDTADDYEAPTAPKFELPPPDVTQTSAE